MGIYAETNFTIECKNKAVAKKVLTVLKKLKTKDDPNYNFNFGSITEAGKDIIGFHSSGRVQNLEWQCEEMWKAIKDIKGVLNADFPIVEEGHVLYFSNQGE